MYPKALGKIAGRLSAVAVIAVGLLPGVVGSAAADEGDFEAPTNIQNTNLAPKCITVTFQHSSSGVDKFTVERAGPNGEGQTLEPHQFNATFCNLEPSTTYHFTVCAVFQTDEADKECTEADLETAAPVPEAPPQQPKPAPRIVASNSGEDWIDFRWEAGYDYHHYYIHVFQPDAPMLTIPHDAPGTWGYWKVNGLAPGRTYQVEVQGCTSGFVEDTCWDWGPRAEIKTQESATVPPFKCLEWGFPGDVIIREGGTGWDVTFSSSGPSASGRATATNPGAASKSGNISGTMQGPKGQVTLTITYDGAPGPRGTVNTQVQRYIGEVGEDAKLHGKTQNAEPKANGIPWSTVFPMSCVKHS